MTQPDIADPTIPGYIAGTWTIDPVHSEVGFSVRHLMLSKLRGRFASVSGDIVTGDSPLDSSVTATIDLGSIETGNPDRDHHLRSADFFDVGEHRTMTFRSTGVRPDGEDYQLDGELTLRDITKPITLQLQVGGFGPDLWGGTRVGFSATGQLKRSDFGVGLNAPLESGGMVIGDKVEITLEIQAVLNT
jgi:polyisoprenoid-binding protein YceI